MTENTDQLIVWINDLDGRALSTRGAAERALLDHAEAARPLLRKALGLTERPLLSAQVALLLQRLHDTGALADLVAAAAAHTHRDVRVILLRAAVELAPGAPDDATLLEATAALSADRDAEVAQWAHQLQERLAPQPVADEERPLVVDADDLASFAALAMNAEDAPLHVALEHLGSRIRDQRREAEQTLLAAGHRGQRLLIEALADGRQRVRAAAARLLTQSPTPDASGALLALAASPADSDEEQELRALALRALAASLVGVEVHIVDDLEALSRDPDRFVRAGVAAALGRLAFEEAAEALVAMLEDRDEFVFEETARALGRIGVPLHLVDAVLRGLDRDVARAHAGLLRAFTGPLAAASYEDEAQRARLLRRARAQLQTAVADRITAALALIDRLFTSPRRLEAVDVTRVVALVRDDDLDVVRASLGLLASHVDEEMGFVREGLMQIQHRDDASVAMLLEVVEERLGVPKPTA